MICLLDSDIVVYRCGFGAEKTERRQARNGDIDHLRHVEPINFAYHNVDTVVDSLASKFDKIECYLSGKDNFRHKISPEYKANRSPFSKPFYYEELRDYLVRKYDAKVIDGKEADDELGLQATSRDDVCIVSIDKDLDMIPGHHYNWVKDKKYYVEETEGLRNFYKQCLTGDRVDNVPGVGGVGTVGAEKLLGKVNSEQAMYGVVRGTWRNRFNHNRFPGRRPDDVLFEVARLLWIQRKGRETWNPPL